MHDPIADLKHELLAAADRQLAPATAVGAGGRRLRVPLTRNRVLLTTATVAVAAAVALFVTTPWKTAPAPGFLEEVQAALTPPAGTVLHMKWEVTTTTPAFSCTVTRGPYEAWIDQAAPHKFRMLLNDSAGLDPRAIACGSGAPSEVGGTLDTQDFPPGLKLPVDLAAWLRERISDGSAHDEGKTEVDGRTVERIRLDGPKDCPVSGCERDPVSVYVDPETFHPIQIESPHGYINLSGRIVRFDIVSRYLTFEYLPGTDENRALADIRA